MFKMIMNGYLGGMTKASCYLIVLTFIHVYTDGLDANMMSLQAIS